MSSITFPLNKTIMKSYTQSVVGDIKTQYFHPFDIYFLYYLTKQYDIMSCVQAHYHYYL